MQSLSAQDVIAALPYDRLVRDLPQLLLRKTESPQRHVHTLRQDGEPDAVLLVMPAWSLSGGGRRRRRQDRQCHAWQCGARFAGGDGQLSVVRRGDRRA
ncbi:MAG: hypothetical protein WDN06_16695 [Asticcacaulis sp.]